MTRVDDDTVQRALKVAGRVLREVVANRQACHDDTLQQATDILDNACLPEQCFNNGLYSALRQDIASAILAERQRCAAVAESVMKENNTVSGFDSQPAFATAFKIRQGILTPPTTKRRPM